MSLSVITFLNEQELICLHTSIVNTQLNGFNYFYPKLKILFYSTLLICLYTVNWFQELLRISKNSIKHQSFVYTLLNDQTVLFLTIQFSISH